MLILPYYVVNKFGMNTSAREHHKLTGKLIAPLTSRVHIDF